MTMIKSCVYRLGLKCILNIILKVERASVSQNWELKAEGSGSHPTFKYPGNHK